MTTSPRPERLDHWFKLSSGDTKPEDVAEAASPETPYPVFGGNGVMGWTAQTNAIGENIIIGRVGANCGCVHYYSGKCWITDNALYTREHRRDYDKRFMALTLQSLGLERLRSKTGQPLVSQGPIHALKAVIPSRQEQVETANTLLLWDAAIQKTERLIAVKAERHLALVGYLIIHPASKDTTWRHERLRNIATRVQRKAGEGEYPILTISSASGFVLQEEKYGRYMAGESVKDYILLRRGEFAYNKGNSLRYQFGCVYQLTDYEEALVPHVYVCFSLHDNIIDSYLRHLFAVDYLKPQLGKLVKTGVRNNGLLNIRPDEFLDITVPIPPLEKQLSIAAALDAASAEITLLKQLVSAYRIQQRGLMQKLLTGQWRVNTTMEVPA